MLRAIELAGNGLGWASPNPQVGCVITRNNLIIGEGWHEKFGGPHAEVNAINQVPNQDWLTESEMYVSLEPCSHTGKTPPCADLIISKGIKTVYIAEPDPNPLVNGNGIKKLENAGVKVVIGIQQEVARKVNKRYHKFFTSGRPYIILKWAQTNDSYIAHADYKSKWISNEISRQLAHKWRSEEDAVLVGYNTVKYDNPNLNIRDWSGKEPARIIIDRDLSLSQELNVFDHTRPTYIFNCKSNISEDNLTRIKIDNQDFLGTLVAKLPELGIQSVLVEGGGSTLRDFITHGFWDEARVFISDKIFSTGISAPRLKDQELLEKKIIGDDMLYIYKNQNNLTLG